MVRWLLALTLLLPPQVSRPVHVPTVAEWVGPLVVRDRRGEIVAPTRATLTIRDGQISGHWWVAVSEAGRPLAGSGSLAGAITPAGAVQLTLTFSSSAEVVTDRRVEIVGLEYCAGTTTLTGQLQWTGVLRLTAPRLRLDTGEQRARGRACEDLTHLLWLLQPLPLR